MSLLEIPHCPTVVKLEFGVHKTGGLSRSPDRGCTVKKRFVVQLRPFQSPRFTCPPLLLPLTPVFLAFSALQDAKNGHDLICLEFGRCA